MKVYRIAKPKRAADLSGLGAFLYGGRWNRQGSTKVLYTASSPSLAILEKIVHVNLATMPRDMCLITIEVPDKAGLISVSEKDLPKGWSDTPGPDELKEVGEKWVSEGKTLLLRVPSAASPHEVDFLINPSHREMARVRVVEVESAQVFARLAEKAKGKKTR